MGEKGSCKAHWRGSKVRHKTGWWSLFPSWSVARLVAGGTTPPLCYTNTQTQNTRVLPAHFAQLCALFKGSRWWVGRRPPSFYDLFLPGPKIYKYPDY